MQEKNLTSSRSKAQELIENGFVLVNNKVVNKPSSSVGEDADVKIKDNDVLKYVSRGGLKLEKAFKVFKVSPHDKVVLDIGSSTGGFTDCSLQYGAKKVVAIDVGTNVMVEKLRHDPRVELHENINIKDAPSSLFLYIDLVVVDVSFISLKHVVERVSNENIKVDMICLIKPQFECGLEIAKKYHGVITSKTAHKTVINNVVEYFDRAGFKILGLDFSPIKGGDGNIEYIAHFSNKVDKSSNINFEKVINSAFNN